MLQFIMPNGYTFRNPSPDKDIPWDDRFQWDVPLDDEHSLQFRLRLVPSPARPRAIIARATLQ